MSEDRQNQDSGNGTARRVPINLGLLHPIGTPQVTPIHALAPGAQSLPSLVVQPLQNASTGIVQQSPSTPVGHYVVGANPRDQESSLNVWVKPNHEEFLDWDLPFGQQEPGIQEKLRSAGMDTSDIRRLTSEDLNRAGIPGVRFVDQSNHPDRTYNYVVHNPDDLEITHTDGYRLTPVDHDPFAQV